MTRKKKKTKMEPLCIFLVFLVVISTLAATVFIGGRSILKTLYPLKYAEFVEVYSKENNLSPFFVYAVIKCESNFDKDAICWQYRYQSSGYTHCTREQAKAVLKTFEQMEKSQNIEEENILGK